jgi:hypothetical protein
MLDKDDSYYIEVHDRNVAPLIRNGDILTMQPIPEVALFAGDVILYLGAEDCHSVYRVVSRILQGKQSAIKMFGDSAHGSAAQVIAEQVLGRIVGVQGESGVTHLNRNFHFKMIRLWI